MEQNIGKLFGTIPLTTDSHLDVLLDTMDESSALFILQQSINHAYRQGAFTLGECEVLAKAMRISGKLMTSGPIDEPQNDGEEN